MQFYGTHDHYSRIPTFEQNSNMFYFLFQAPFLFGILVLRKGRGGGVYSSQQLSMERGNCYSDTVNEVEERSGVDRSLL
jgi:hypothetical protein